MLRLDLNRKTYIINLSSYPNKSIQGYVREIHNITKVELLPIIPFFDIVTKTFHYYQLQEPSNILIIKDKEQNVAKYIERVYTIMSKMHEIIICNFDDFDITDVIDLPDYHGAVCISQHISNKHNHSIKGKILSYQNIKDSDPREVIISYVRNEMGTLGISGLIHWLKIKGIKFQIIMEENVLKNDDIIVDDFLYNILINMDFNKMHSREVAYSTTNYLLTNSDEIKTKKGTITSNQLRLKTEMIMEEVTILEQLFMKIKTVIVTIIRWITETTVYIHILNVMKPKIKLMEERYKRVFERKKND